MHHNRQVFTPFSGATTCLCHWYPTLPEIDQAASEPGVIPYQGWQFDDLVDIL